MAALELALTRWGNPFIGTGNVFPSAVCPQGMRAWSPDTTSANRIAGGYQYPDGAILDFSLTHFSGRGGPCLKDIPFLLVIGPITGSPGPTSDRATVREGLKSYLRRGDVPDKAAITLEYCHDDFALARFTKALGDRKQYAVCLCRAQNRKDFFDTASP